MQTSSNVTAHTPTRAERFDHRGVVQLVLDEQLDEARYAFAGALIADLAEAGRVVVDEAAPCLVNVVNETPVGVPVLDATLEQLRKAKPGSLGVWIDRLATKPPTQPDLTRSDVPVSEFVRRLARAGEQRRLVASVVYEHLAHPGAQRPA